MEWYLAAFKKYSDFTGRARRKEYWMFALFSSIFSIAAGVLDGLIGSDFMGSYGILTMLYGLAVFIPSLALTVRRLHDVGKSGAYIFIGLIPLVGAIWLLVLVCTDSQPQDNQYGPNPKAI